MTGQIHTMKMKRLTSERVYQCFLSSGLVKLIQICLSKQVIMTEAYASLDLTIKWYDYGSNIPFNFNFITDVNNSSKPTDFKKVIDDWVSRTPKTGSANWVVREMIKLNLIC